MIKKILIAFVLTLGLCEPSFAQGNYSTGYFTSYLLAGNQIDPANTLQIQLANNTAGGLTWTLPASNGTANQVLVTNGASPLATLTWTSVSSLITDDVITDPGTSARNQIIATTDIVPLSIKEVASPVALQFMVRDNSNNILDEIFPDGTFSSIATITANAMIVSGESPSGAAIIDGTENIRSLSLPSYRVLVGTGGNPVAGQILAGPGIGITYAGSNFTINARADSTHYARTDDSTHFIDNQKNALQTASYRISGSGSIGGNDTTGGNQYVSGSLSVGNSNTLTGTHAFALGGTSTASNVNSIALGAACTASGVNDIALGASATASGGFGFAWGAGASGATSTNGNAFSVVFGDASAATSNDATNQFMVRASGGYKLYDDATSTVALSLASATGLVYNKPSLGPLAPTYFYTFSGSWGTPGVTIENTTASTSGTTQQLAPSLWILGTRWSGSASILNGWALTSSNNVVSSTVYPSLTFGAYTSTTSSINQTYTTPASEILYQNPYGASLSLGLNTISTSATNSIVQGGDNGCCGGNAITAGYGVAVLGGALNAASGNGLAIIGSYGSFNNAQFSGIYSGNSDTIPNNTINGGNPGVGMVILGGEGLTNFSNGLVVAGQFDTVPAHSSSGFSTSDAWLVGGNGTSYGAAKNNALVCWKTGDLTIGNLANHKTITITQTTPTASRIDTLQDLSGPIALDGWNAFQASGDVEIDPVTGVVTTNWNHGATVTTTGGNFGVSTVTLSGPFPTHPVVNVTCHQNTVPNPIVANWANATGTLTITTWQGATKTWDGYSITISGN